MKQAIVALAAAAAITAGAQAQDTGFSASIGYDYIDFDDASFNSVALRGRADFSKHFGAELQANFGLGDDTVDFAGSSVDVELNYLIGAFLTAQTGGEQSNLFARVGYVNAEIEANLAGFSASEDDGALAAGVGGEFFWDERNGFRVDYTYADYDDAVSAFGISYVRRFGG